MAEHDEKKSSHIKVWLPPSLAKEIHTLANQDQRKTSDYIGVVLRRHAFGHATAPAPAEGVRSAAVRGGVGR